MKFKSEVVTQASGSIGGTTYSHNKGGMYRRARAIPTNPNSVFQQTVRTFMAEASAAWSNTLTALQRVQWNNYAAATPVTDVLGDSIQLSGQNMFVRQAVMRRRTGKSPILDGPSTPGLAEFNGVTVTDGVGSYNVNYDATDAWANDNDGVLAIQDSRILAAGVSYFRGPYRFNTSVSGSGTTPPTSPENVTFNAFGQIFAGGETVSVRVCGCDAEGRLTPVVEQLVTMS